MKENIPVQQITTEVDAGVVLVRFHNPPHGFMDGGTEEELTAVLDDIEHNNTIRAVVMTGGLEDVFIRHYDVAVLYERGKAMAARGLSFDVTRPVPEAPLHACLRRMEASPKPFIAAINGTAMGGGLELALACDIRLALDGRYDLGLPEINLGLLPGAGGTQRLTRLIGEAKALELQLLGRTINPGEAKAIGLVAECVAGDVIERALALAQTLASRSPRALGHIKHLVRSAADRPLGEALARERTLFCDLMVDARALTEMGEFVAGKRDIRDPEHMAGKRERKTVD